MMSVSNPDIVEGGTYVFQSRSDPRKDYTTIITTEGRMQCDCLGWTIKRVGKPRRCRHTDDVSVIEGQGYTPGTGDEADYVFLVPNPDDMRFVKFTRVQGTRRYAGASKVKAKPTPTIVEETRDPSRSKTDIAPGVVRQRRIILD